MAKSQSKGGVNKSQAIRDALTANPKAGSKTIVAQLAEKGIKVSPTLVYFIKSQSKRAKQSEKRQRLAASMNGRYGNPVDVVRKVKTLAGEVGGIKNLKSLVDLLAE